MFSLTRKQKGKDFYVVKRVKRSSLNKELPVGLEGRQLFVVGAWKERGVLQKEEKSQRSLLR